MRRRAGIGGIQQSEFKKDSFKVTGDALAAAHNEELISQAAAFKNQLETFAKRHSAELVEDELLRTKFQRMCSALGVDVMSSSKGGFWPGSSSEFYRELGVQIVETCLVLSEQTGGLADISIVQARISRLPSRDRITEAVEYLSPLGSGINIIDLDSVLDFKSNRSKSTLGSIFSQRKQKARRLVIQSVPLELSSDTTVLLSFAETSGGFFTALAFTQIGWTSERFNRAVALMVEDGLVWIDLHTSEITFWCPGLFSGFS